MDEASESLLEVVITADREISAFPPQDPHGFYELLHRTACRIAEVDSFYVCLYLEADGTLFFPFNIDRQAYDDPVTLPLGEGPTSWVIRNRCGLVLSEETQTIHRGGIAFGDTRQISRSAVHLPMCASDWQGMETVLGVISAQAYRPGAYSPEVVRALEWLASRAGAQLQRERDCEAWSGEVTLMQGRVREIRRALPALTSEFVRILRDLGAEVEGLQHRLPLDLPDLHRIVEQLAQKCRRYQTEANQLPLQRQFGAVTSPELPDPFPYPTGASLNQAPTGPPLTSRELQVLRLLAVGHSSKQIAAQLHVTLETVKFHCANLYRKLGAANRVQAIRFGAPLLLDQDREGTHPNG